MEKEKSLAEVAEFFNMNKEDLVEFLKEVKVFNDDNLPKQKYVEKGYFKLVS